jgi:hypothetical protein
MVGINILLYFNHKKISKVGEKFGKPAQDLKSL